MENKFDAYNEVSLGKRIANDRRTFPHHEMTEFERFIGHENFGFYLYIAFTVKGIRKCLLSGTVPNASQVLLVLGRNQGENELETVAHFIQSRFIPSYANVTFVPNVHDLPRGKFMDTDSLIDESIYILRKEFARCMTWYCQSSSSQPLTNSAARATRTKRLKPLTRKGKNGKSIAIAVKYSKHQKDILNNWMIAHRKNPFPTSTEIQALGAATNLSVSQVVNWTTNVRKRNLKATVEKGKKPHHFIDFLFLADSKEEDDDGEGGTKGSAQKKTKKKKRKPKKGAASKGSTLKKNSKGKKSTSSRSYSASEQSGATVTRAPRAPRAPAASTASTSVTSSTASEDSISDKMAALKTGGVTVTNHHTTSKAQSEIEPTPLDYGMPFHGGFPNLLNGFMLPQVTPPRALQPLDLPQFETTGVRDCAELPRDSTTADSFHSGEDFRDDVDMLREITRDGLVPTPQRRASDENLFVDIDQTQLMTQLANVFRDREEEDRLDIDTDPNNNSFRFDDLEMMDIGNKDDLGDSEVMKLLGDDLDDVDFEL